MERSEKMQSCISKDVGAILKPLRVLLSSPDQRGRWIEWDGSE